MVPTGSIRSVRAGPPHWGQSLRLALGPASALGFGRFAYGLLIPAMRTELHWGLAAAGTLTTANSLGYLLGAVAAAPVARRLGVAVTFRLGMVMTAAALAVTAAAGASYPALFLTRMAAGLAGAFVFITAGVIAARTAARVRSAAPLTVCFAGAGLGIAVSGVVIPPLLGHHPGRWPLAWASLAAAAGLAAVISWSAAQGGREGGTTAPVIHLRSVGRLWQVAVVYLLFAAGYIAYITFLSAYLAAHHASVGEVVLTWAVLGLAAVAAPALWSRPISTWSDARALAALLAGLSAAAALALITTAPAAVTGSAVGYGVTFLGVPAAITALTRAAVAPQDWTGALAAFTVVFAAGQMAGPYLAGALADRYGTGATLAWTAALCGAGAVMSAAIRPRAAPTLPGRHGTTRAQGHPRRGP